jgi:hypothetical protein
LASASRNSHTVVASGRIFQPKAQKAHEREPVADLIFDLLIGQIVKCLQHQNLEHHDGVEGLAAGVALPLLGCKPNHRLDLGPEALERNKSIKRLERITLGTYRLKTSVEVEKARLPQRIPLRCRCRDT